MTDGDEPLRALRYQFLNDQGGHGSTDARNSDETDSSVGRRKRVALTLCVEGFDLVLVGDVLAKSIVKAENDGFGH